MVAADLRRKGYKIAIPFGEDWDYDLIIERKGRLERVQVKYATAIDGVIPVRCLSHSLTNGKVKRTKAYTPSMIDWIAVFSPTTERCYYVQASELGVDGRSNISLRLRPPRNAQRIGIRFADDYLDLGAPAQQSIS
jgi:PD-(D/E)XK nuclease superfamily protein